MSSTYAIKICKSDLSLLTFLNGGVAPLVATKNDHLIVVVDEKGKNTTTKIVTERELSQNYETAGTGALLIRLQK